MDREKSSRRCAGIGRWLRQPASHLGEPLRDRFGLPPETDLDQLLCAVYLRTFVTDRDDDEVFGISPFASKRPGCRASLGTPSCPWRKSWTARL